LQALSDNARLCGVLLSLLVAASAELVDDAEFVNGVGAAWSPRIA
jgi:hypothetical protein